MEIVQWTSLWGFFKNEYQTEKNLLGGALGAKAAGDLKLSIADHDIAWLSPSTMRGLPSVGLQNLLSLSL
ncbi:hypothetical protein BDA96_05G083400 [Sorghum bicolor]|uniref:Uncharacterized protein n=1 Tax=Sorghum bicolor TaxID=4558 RepID=A0A921QWZ6_SORBI|nr:hypothetical protein BDA96_05G083400 [Sorghum bicolor]